MVPRNAGSYTTQKRCALMELGAIIKEKTSVLNEDEEEYEKGVRGANRSILCTNGSSCKYLKEGN